jgi:endogenous inhibitor of DNA gyrase (YacG/DUF329 family)
VLTFIIILLLAALLALPTGLVARHKGHTFWKWWLLGYLLFPFALVASFFIKDWRRHCPHCGKVVAREASVCPHCQREIESYALKPRVTA